MIYWMNVFVILLSLAVSLQTSEMEKSYVCDDTVYATIDAIPEDATELIFKAGSYQSIVEADFSRFVLLKRIIFGDHTFTNCHGMILKNPHLTSIVFGNGFLSGSSIEGRRLRCSTPGLYITAPKLKNMRVSSQAVNNMNEVVLEGMSGNVAVTVDEGAFNRINVITTSEESRLFAMNLKEAIEEVYPSREVEIVVPVEEPSLPVVPNVVISALQSGEEKLTSETFASYFYENQISADHVEILTIFSTSIDPYSIIDLTILTRLEKVIFVTDDSEENNMINMNNLMLSVNFSFEVLSEDEFNNMNNPTEYPTVLPPTTSPSSGILVIRTDSDCEKLYNINWSKVMIPAEMCNNLTAPLNITNNPHLTTFAIGDNSLTNIPSIELSNNYALRIINFGENTFSQATSLIVKGRVLFSF